MGNLPIVKDLVVDMDPFWQKMRAIQPYLSPRLDRATERRTSSSRSTWTSSTRSPLHQLRLLRVGVQLDGVRPDFLGPAALAKGFRFVGDARDGATIERLERYSEEHGLWDCTRCYFCNERCPKESTHGTPSQSSAPRP